LKDIFTNFVIQLFLAGIFQQFLSLIKHGMLNECWKKTRTGLINTIKKSPCRRVWFLVWLVKNQEWPLLSTTAIMNLKWKLEVKCYSCFSCHVLSVCVTPQIQGGCRESRNSFLSADANYCIFAAAPWLTNCHSPSHIPPIH